MADGGWDRRSSERSISWALETAAAARVTPLSSPGASMRLSELDESDASPPEGDQLSKLTNAAARTSTYMRAMVGRRPWLMPMEPSTLLHPEDRSRSPGRACLEGLIGVEQDRHRPVVDESHLHGRTEVARRASDAP
jgi:hypothetical protein